MTAGAQSSAGADDRIVWLDPVETISDACVLCGHRENNVVFMRAQHPDTALGFMNVARCAGCASAWFPEFDAVAMNYPSDAAMIDRDDFGVQVSHYLELVGGIDWKIQLAERLPMVHVSSMLEVGCNAGKFLDYCRSMWNLDVVGLEPSIYGVAGARALDLPILQRYMAEAHELAGRTFDFVCAIEVLEHVEDPLTFLRELRSFLASDGVAMITTPRPQALNASTPRGELLAALSTGAHRFLIAPERLRELARTAGFAWTHIESFGMTQVAYLAAQPVELGESPDAEQRAAEYHARRVESGSGDARQQLGDLISAYIGSRECGESPDADLERRIELGIESQFDISLRQLDAVLARLQTCSNFIEFGEFMPYRLATYLFWRGQRDDVSESDRTELWEASALIAALGLRVDPVNLFVYIDTLRPAVQALAGRVPGRHRRELIDALDELPDVYGTEIVSAKVATRALAWLRSTRRRWRRGSIDR